MARATGARYSPAAPVVRVAVPVPLPQLFDYLPPAGQALPAVGSRVLVPFGRRRLVGLVVEHGPPDARHRAALKPVERVLDPALISPAQLELARRVKRYWVFAPGELVNLLLPGALRRTKPFQPPPPSFLSLTEQGRAASLKRAPRQAEVRKHLLDGPLAVARLRELSGASTQVLASMKKAGLVQALHHPPPAAPRAGPELNAEQRAAAAAVLRRRRGFHVFLLAGVTSSGKTEVYLRIARQILQTGRQVLVLAPEIGLAPQLVRRIESRLGCAAWLYHSGLSEGERLATWQAARSGAARVVVGTRSAVFLPLLRPGLIVVDEEHDSSFKQAEGARYHGRDVAVLRARQENIPVILGSATPSLESLHNVDRQRYTLLELPRRAGAARPPRLHVIDQRGSKSAVHPQLLSALQKHLGQGGQALVYRNRRGYAPVLMCSECGWQADCRRCSAHLTWHRHDRWLKCHHCGSQRREPPRCPDCQSPSLFALGSGTERLEEQLAEAFPDVPVRRVDRDVMSGKHDFESLLEEVRAGQPCILVGTQMLAKGHHLPNVTLAAVVDVDQALFSADFRAPERLGQTVAQVSGRAGRGAGGGEFLLLTRHPEHALVQSLLEKDYLNWVRPLLAERRDALLPPARALALVRAQAHDAEVARRFLREARAVLANREVEIIGPLPAVLERRGGYWRFQLWLQAQSRPRLAHYLWQSLPALHRLPSARHARWHVDMDPLEL